MFDIKLKLYVEKEGRYYEKKVYWECDKLPETKEELIDLFKSLDKIVKGKLMNVSISSDEIDQAVEMGYAKYIEISDDYGIYKDLIILDDNYKWLNLNIDRENFFED